MADLIKGNEDQQKAIVLNQGPALILAGPGSGKTFTIVERIRYLITHHGVNAENILVITFTKAAARQMRERFQTRMGGMACPVNFGTFHAVFYHILKTSASYNSDAVLSEKEKREYLRRILMTLPGEFTEKYHVDFKVDTDWENGLLGEFGFLKNAGHIPEDFHSAYLEDTVFKRVFLEFQHLLKRENKMDFDDFAAHCLYLFNTRPEVAKSWQEKFSYILVDEFQDINPAQYAVVKLLAGDKRNLFVVGDDDQSIYGFRASSPAIMKQFLIDYPDAKKILLSVNYRCAPGIVETAGRLIAVNKERFEKKIRAGKKICSESEKQYITDMNFTDTTEIKKNESWEQLSPDKSVLIAGFTDRTKQADAVVSKILQLKKDGVTDTAVIFRTNSDALLVAEALSSAQIPFFFQESVKSPYEHFVCQDLLAYLRFAYQGQSRGDFYRIMNRPCRYLSRQAVSGGRVNWSEIFNFYQEKSWMLPHLRRFQADMTRIEGMDLFAAVHYIRRGAGYDEWMSKSMQGEAYRQAVEMADFFKDSVRKFASLEQFCDHVSEYEKQLEISNKNKGTVKKGQTALLTMHGAKGLEFEHVFLPDCNEGIIPHKKSMKAKEVEEERRMFYVGMTRAKEKLYISWVAGTPEEPGFPSRFLGDLGYREPWRNS